MVNNFGDSFTLYLEEDSQSPLTNSMLIKERSPSGKRLTAPGSRTQEQEEGVLLMDKQRGQSESESMKVLDTQL